MARFRDGDWDLFDWDPVTGRTVWHMFDGESDIFKTELPVENVCNVNQQFLNDSLNARWGDGKRVASIPLNVWHDENLGLDKAHIEGDDNYLSRWLNDGDNAAFRTFPGRV